MPSIITHLTDFSDRLPPMLVKELRQGLRAKMFIVVFLSLQAFLAITLLFASSTASTENSGSVVSGMIFSFFAIAVIIVQPLRGVAALSAEVKSNTLEMMVLTRLSAQRIVLGKWTALVSQSALILSTIIPYLILRYFFGGMNLIGEVVLLGLLFFTSMVFTAITVGLSGSTSAIIRAIIPLLALPLLLVFFGFFSRGSNNLVELCTLDSKESVLQILTFILIGGYLGYSALSLGISLIAPAAENHSSVRRIVALLAIAALVATVHFGTLGKDLYFIMTLLIIAPAIAISLTESSILIPTVCTPFVKRGMIGKWLGVFLYPGLASGIFFSLLLAITALTALIFHPAASYTDDQFVVIGALLGGLLLPAVGQLFFFKGNGQRVASYALILIAAAVLAAMLAALSAPMSEKSFLWLFVWDPLVFLVMLDHSAFSGDALHVGVVAIDGLLALILFVGAMRLHRADRAVIQQASDALRNPN